MTLLDILVVVFFIFCFIGLGICAMILIRNGHVSAYRLALIDYCFKKNIEQLHNDHTIYVDYFDKYKAGPSYEYMVYRFWRDLDSFYPEELQTKNRGPK